MNRFFFCDDVVKIIYFLDLEIQMAFRRCPLAVGRFGFVFWYFSNGALVFGEVEDDEVETVLIMFKFFPF